MRMASHIDKEDAHVRAGFTFDDVQSLFERCFVERSQRDGKKNGGTAIQALARLPPELVEIVINAR